jgi:serine/threonine protein kinase
MAAAVAPEEIAATSRAGTAIRFHTNKKGNGANNILGRGGEAIVYRGTSNLPVIHVAVKKIRLPADEESGAYVSLIGRIANSITASLIVSERTNPKGCNPRILCLYAVVAHPTLYDKLVVEPGKRMKQRLVYTSEGIDTQLCYMLYELVEGRDLEKVIWTTPAHTEVNYPKYGAQLLEAVNMLHSAPISLVHLDIKSSNAMIGADDNLVLIDMGTACPLKLVSCQRETMSFHYSGPEAHPRNRRLMAKLAYSDVFATGIVLYEMIMRPRDAAGDPVYALPLAEDSYPGYSDFWDSKSAEAAALVAAGAAAGNVSPGSTDVPGELNLPFSPEKEFLKPLIYAMTKRDYKERPTMPQCVAIWQELFTKEPKPTVPEAEDVVRRLFVPIAPKVKVIAAEPGAGADPGGGGADPGGGGADPGGGGADPGGGGADPGGGGADPGVAVPKVAAAPEKDARIVRLVNPAESKSSKRI